jgi:hypothetical protein
MLMRTACGCPAAGGVAGVVWAWTGEGPKTDTAAATSPVEIANRAQKPLSKRITLPLHSKEFEPETATTAKEVPESRHQLTMIDAAGPGAVRPSSRATKKSRPKNRFKRAPARQVFGPIYLQIND